MTTATKVPTTFPDAHTFIPKTPQSAACKTRDKKKKDIKLYSIPLGTKVSIADPQAMALVVQPFTVKVSPIEGEPELLATSDIANIYEIALTPRQTVERYLKSLLDEFVWLQRHKETVSNAILEELRLLERHLKIVQ